MPDVANNADDFVRFLIQRSQAETLPQRVFANEEVLRKYFTDEDNFRIVVHFRLGEVAAFEQRDAHGAKIVVIDIADIRVRALSGKWSRVAFDCEREVGR